MTRCTSQKVDRRSADRPSWIWLEGRLGEVLALARRLPDWRKLLRQGWDAEDLQQELLLRIWERQETREAYDPRRGMGFGSYMTMLSRGILANLLGKGRTVKAQSEQLGAVQVLDGVATIVDASLVAEGEVLPELSRRGRRRLQAAEEFRDEAERALRWRARGLSRGSRGREGGVECA